MEYRVRLEQFEGPLDLLLHLIEASEVDVRDIFVSEITSQYLAYMNGLDALDMDTASEFLTVAATLLYLKSRRLLPRPPKDETEEEDPEQVLIRQLREYKAFKQAGEELRALYESAKGAFTRLPEEITLGPQEVNLSGATLDQLYEAFFTLLHTEREEAPINPLHRVRQDEYTVRSQIVMIREKLREKSEIGFMELFSGQASKVEMIATFMALLEMIAHGEIELHQSKPFTPIHLQMKALLEDDEDTDYMDEYEV